MFSTCACCGSTDFRNLFQKPLPLSTFISDDTQFSNDLFRTINIVTCENCLHVFNRSFEDDIVAQLYEDVPLPCNPVHPSMFARHAELLDWIGVTSIQSKKILEIGGGSGHFARLLSQTADRVDVFEPNVHLTDAAMPEHNIDIFHENFTSAARHGNVYDFIIMRQVAEHIPDIEQILIEVSKSLAEGGLAYIEVPSLEYIIENNAYVDLHFEHVHYFTANSLCQLAQRASLYPVRLINIMRGHDFGILFRKGAPSSFSVPSSHVVLDSLSEFANAITSRIERASEILNNARGPVALYGATTHTQMFLNTLLDPGEVSCVYDDNDLMAGCHLFSKHGKVPVFFSPDSDINAAKTIIIGAYLHTDAIGARLIDRGYRGTIQTIGPSTTLFKSIFS